MGNNQALKICVYCSSSAQLDQKYYDATEALAFSLLKEKAEIIYGAGSIGLMGKLADVYLENGGKIKGIIPEFMKKVEWDHKGLSDLVVTKTMAERKQLLFEGVDAIVTLPGGMGTLEELSEILSMKKLGQFYKPIILLNVDHFYDPLIEMIDRMIDQKFMNEYHRDLYKVTDDPEEVIALIKSTPDWTADAINYAVNN